MHRSARAMSGARWPCGRHRLDSIPKRGDTGKVAAKRRLLHGFAAGTLAWFDRAGSARWMEPTGDLRVRRAG